MNRQEEIDKNAHEHFAHGWQGSLIDAYIEGAEWADKTMLDRVCEWLEDNIYDYLYIYQVFNVAEYKHELIEDLRKAMEE